MKTTKKDFVSFRGHCLEWQKKFGLLDWVVYFYHKKIDDSYANTMWQMSSSVAVITLSTSWDDGRPLSDVELDRLALHEVLHVLLAKLIAEAEARYTTQSAIDIAEHSIIRSLENSLMEFPNA